MGWGNAERTEGEEAAGAAVVGAGDEVEEAGHAADGLGVNLLRRVFSPRRRRRHRIALCLHHSLTLSLSLSLSLSLFRFTRSSECVFGLVVVYRVTVITRTT